MRIFSKKILREFWEKHSDARYPLEAWYSDTLRANWNTPSDIKKVYRNASFLADNRVIFDIKGNNYRLIIKVHYNRGRAYIRFVGTHAEYDRIDANRI